MKTFALFALSIVLLPLAALRAQSTYAPPFRFTTFAGLPSGAGSVDGSGPTVRFNRPSNLAVDSSGNVYVADTNNNTVRKITSAGVVSTFAGSPGVAGSADGTGSSARFASLNGVAVDSSDNIYVADTLNNTVRKITPAGVVTTLAGLAGTSGTADGTGSAARFYSPFALAVDASGNVFVADTYSYTIRKVTPAGVVTTFAGLPGVPGSADGTGSAARFYFPSGITVDVAGNLYVADTFNSTIRKITAAGVVTTLAGAAGNSGSADGTGSAARFNLPSTLTVDSAGNVYVADTANNTVRTVTATGVVTTLAGTAGSAGGTDGTDSAARFNGPAGITVDGSGTVFVSDTTNDTIRKVTGAGVVTTLAGSPAYSSADGVGAAARFTFPIGVAVDASGNTYVTDSGNDTIRKITSAGAVSTLAGSAGLAGSADGTGSAARFNNPVAVALDGSGNVYVADSGNNTVRKVTAAGVVTTLAGTAGTTGSTDGTGSAARFNYPSGISLDAAGNAYVADGANNTIRKITPAGVVTTLAGTAGTSGSADGTGAAARFNYPAGLAVDASGNIYVSDAGNNMIRKVTLAGVVTTLAGTSTAVGATDGTGAAALFSSPRGVAVDSVGNLYVADFNNSTIRKVTAQGVVTTLAGSPGLRGSADGTGSVARFAYPAGVAVNAAGVLFVADYGNNTIRRGVEATTGATKDFNGDGQADIVWQNTTTGDRGFWLMNGTTYTSWVDMGIVSTDWQIAGVGDFNGDGQTDIVWQNTSTGDRGFWLMNGTTFTSWVDMGIVSTDWQIAGVGDFNGDGKTDIVWQNTSTGDRGFWLMNGTTYTSWVDMGIVSTDWQIAGAGDFNGDGQADIVWQNTTTGDRGFWLMNGTTFTRWVALGVVSTDWQIAGVGEFNGDGNTDIVWQNTSTGDRGFWLMNGTTYISWVALGTISPDWRIAH